MCLDVVCVCVRERSFSVCRNKRMRVKIEICPLTLTRGGWADPRTPEKLNHFAEKNSNSFQVEFLILDPPGLSGKMVER